MLAIALLDAAALDLRNAEETAEEPPKRAPQLRRVDVKYLVASPSQRWLRRRGPWAPLTLSLPDGRIAGVRWVACGAAIAPAVFSTDPMTTSTLEVVSSIAAARSRLAVKIERMRGAATVQVERYLPSLPASIELLRRKGQSRVLSPSSIVDGRALFTGPDAGKIAVLAGRDGIVLPIGGGEVIALVRIRGSRRGGAWTVLFDSREAGTEVNPFEGDPLERAEAVIRQVLDAPTARAENGSRRAYVASTTR